MTRYNPKEIEQKWQTKWLKEGIYEPDFALQKARDKKAAKRPFYNLMMFPYLSAEGLHVGNMYAFTGADIYGRFKRMQGYDVFEPIGLDGFGIHSENYAIKIGRHPADQAKISEKNFYRQLQMIGNGFAWDERLETYDPEYYKWTQWIFVQMFKRGLAYRKKAPVNWCPSCMTVLADEQVIQKSQIPNPKFKIQNSKHETKIAVCERCDTPVVKKELEQWFFKITDYAGRLLKNLEKIDWSERIKIAQKNWIGRSEGALINFALRDKKNYLFLHAYKASPDRDFWPWLKRELEGAGNEVFAPQLPNPSEPNIEEQVQFLLKNYQFNKDTVVVTHSLGGVLAMKLLPRLKSRISGLVMVAPPLRTEFLDGKKRPALEKATDWEFDFASVAEKADRISVLKDTLDHIVPANQPEEIARRLKAKLVETVARQSHFTSSEEPAVLSELSIHIQVFTTRPDTLFGATYLVLSPEHPWLTQEIQNPKSKIQNKSQIQNYIDKAREKTDEERIAEGREKTGVELKGIKAINPANGERIPVWVADYVLGNVGTGAIMAVPAHDQRDYEFAKKYNLPIRYVIDPVLGTQQQKPKEKFKIVALVEDGNEVLTINWGPDKGGRLFVGGTMEDGENVVKTAMREVSEETGYGDLKFVAGGEETVHYEYFSHNKKTSFLAHTKVLHFELNSRKRGEQKLEDNEKGWFSVEWVSKDQARREVIDPLHRYAFDKFVDHKCWSGEGLLTNSGKWNGLLSEIAKWKITASVRGERKNWYRLRDWLISRQRYWGPPIPMVYCKMCGWQSVPEEDLPVRLPYIKDFRPTGTEKSPLATVEKFWKVRCPKCKSWARRETDVSDTFLDSAWYYLGYLAKENSKFEIPDSKFRSRAKRWLPVDMYIGGAEHAVLHLLYVRFLATAFYDWKLLHFEEPFKKFRAHGLLIKDGAKMSKSRGNVVNPDEYIKAYGADALRMYLMFLGPFEQGGDFRDTGIRGVTRFLERAWKLVTEKPRTLIKNRKIESVLHRTIKKVTEDIENLQYNTAVAALMSLLNAFEEKSEEVSQEHIKIFLKLLAPFAPHMSEELYQELFGDPRRFRSVHTEPWPKYDPKLIQEATFELIIQVNGRVRGRLTLPIGASEEKAKKAALAEESVKKYLTGEPRKVIFVPGRLINLVA